MARNYGLSFNSIPSALAAAMPADRPLARTADPAVPVAGKIQSSRRFPPFGGTDSEVSRPRLFIIAPFESGEISQAAVDVLAFVFGIFFVGVCTIGLAAAIGALIYFAVV